MTQNGANMTRIYDIETYKKLSYRRRTARCVVSVVISPIATQQCTNYLYTTSPEQIEVMKLKRYRKAMCNKHVHSTMTRSSRFRCPVGVINKTDDGRVVNITYIPTTCLWRNFLSPQCRNCSRDPDHAHLGNTHSSQD